MPELGGKGWRVLGYFLWMLGAGIVLDGRPGFAGKLLLAAGAGLFLLGVWQSSAGAGGVAE
jgi:hypothetical protein